MQKHALLNVRLRQGRTGFVSPFAFLFLVSQMHHYTYKPLLPTLSVHETSSLWLQDKSVAMHEFIGQVRITWGGQASIRECVFSSTQSPARKHHLHAQHSYRGMAGRWEGRANHVLHASSEV